MRPGDVVQAGVSISNSETGRGAVSVCPLVYRLVCTNGMCPQHTLGRINTLEPAVDVVGQQLRIIPPHLFVILDGDVQIGAELAVGRGLNVHRLHQVMAALIQNEDGSICIQPVAGGEEIKKNSFATFPEKVYWPRLAKVLEAAGTAIGDEACGIS